MAKSKKQKAARAERRRIKRAAEIDALMETRAVPKGVFDAYEKIVQATKSSEQKTLLEQQLAEWGDGQFTPGARAAAGRLADILRDLGKPAATPKRPKIDTSHLIQFVAHDGSTVTVDTKSHPLLRIYKTGAIDAPQLEAASRFRRDYDKANYSGIRGPGLEPRVDTSGFSGANLYAVDAQRRLKDLRLKVGDGPYLLLEAICGCDMSISQIYEAGGDDRNTISAMLQQALNKAAAFYDLIEREPDTKTVRALREVLFHTAKRRGEHVI